MLCNHACFTTLQRQWDNGHPHLPWRLHNNKWATNQEVEYPHELCMAHVCRRTLLGFGVLDDSMQLEPTFTSTDHSSRVATGVLPRGKRLRPLIREHSCKVKITGTHVNGNPIGNAHRTQQIFFCSTR